MRALVLGGTGTLGKEVIRRLLEDESNGVICFSRCELKQKQLAQELRYPERLIFILGDIRDRDSLDRAMSGIDTVFSVAALKHIDVLEHNPEESVKTNILGTINVAESAIAAKVPHVVFTSTDKAQSPINVYGMCKGISEKILFNKNRTQSETKFAVYRWGNIAASRGSAIPIFVSTLKSGAPVPITDRAMSRFWLKIEDAVAFMLSTYKTASTDSVMVPPLKAARVLDVVEALADLTGVNSYSITDVPIRPGEKLHEDMLPGLRSDTAPQFTKEELKSLLRGSV